MAEGLGDRLFGGLLLNAGTDRCVATAGERERQRQNEQQEHGEREQRRLPADAVDQSNGGRREQKLPERSCRRSGPEREHAPAVGHKLAECADHKTERASGEPEPDQHAGAEVQHRRGRRRGHQPQTQCVENGAGGENPDRAELVGKRAGKRLARAPQDILDRQRERKYVAIPMLVDRHRHQKLAERRARTETQHRDQAAGNDDDGGRLPGGNLRPGGARRLGNRCHVSTPRPSPCGARQTVAVRRSGCLM